MRTAFKSLLEKRFCVSAPLTARLFQPLHQKRRCPCTTNWKAASNHADLRRTNRQSVDAESSVEIVHPAALLLSVLDTHLKRCVGWWLTHRLLMTATILCTHPRSQARASSTWTLGVRSVHTGPGGKKSAKSGDAAGRLHSHRDK